MPSDIFLSSSSMLVHECRKPLSTIVLREKSGMRPVNAMAFKGQGGSTMDKWWVCVCAQLCVSVCVYVCVCLCVAL